MEKIDYLRSPDSAVRQVDYDLKVDGVFTVPNITDSNVGEQLPNSIGMKDGVLVRHNGEKFVPLIDDDIEDMDFNLNMDK